jgi:hypothetical protein
LLRIRDRLLHRFFGDLVDQNPMHPAMIFCHLIGDMPGDRLPFAVGIGGEIDMLFAAGGFFQIVDDFFLRLDHMEVRRKIFLDIDAEFALRQIDDVTDRRLDLKIAP